MVWNKKKFRLSLRLCKRRTFVEALRPVRASGAVQWKTVQCQRMGRTSNKLTSIEGEAKELSSYGGANNC